MADLTSFDLRPVDLRSILRHTPESAVQELSIAYFRSLLAIIVSETVARFRKVSLNLTFDDLW